MTELLTAARMRAAEQAVISAGEATGLELMERAGRGVVEAILEQWPGLEGRGASPSRSPGYLQQEEKAPRAVVLCGPGNNGGDGFVVARLLHGRGWAVEVFLYGEPARLPPDARENCERWRKIGPVLPLTAAVVGSGDLAADAAIIVDALFGTGLTRPVELPLAALAPKPEAGAVHRLVAVDIPSGLCADSGRRIADGIAAPADLTVTFHARKPGQVLAEGPAACGRTVVKDIGIGAGACAQQKELRAAARAEGARHAGSPGDIVTLVDRPTGSLGKSGGDHKYIHGHALILSGGAGRTGAARLAALGALRAGAGLVTLGVTGAAQPEVAGRITALMLTRVEDAQGLAGVLRDTRINALCLGPGLGGERARALVPVALRAAHIPCVVLDADALTAFADDPPALSAMLHDRCVLTPHAGEFARLFPDIAARLAETPIRGPAYSKLDAARAAARRAGCVVLLKGPDTVIAAADGRCSINSAHCERAAPWLATAGSGDVLSGYITGLLARGFGPRQAAETGAWLHVACALAFGPGLIAEDLPGMVPQVFRDLGI